ncbi:MAG: hypothetical protein P4L36_14705 [Holophaga sp.]|nr:hypothetical protein [Holophaga sp.]
MKLTTILAAGLLLSAAPMAMANVNIQKDANAKKDGTTYTCKTCHSALPGTKANLNDTGKKFIKK